MNRHLIAVTALALALVAPGAAGAGGWATVGLTPLPPEDAGAGTAWTPTLTVLQHGRTPLDGVRPVVLLRGESGQTQEFPAVPTGEPGTYRAEVKLPADGRWRVVVDDGFGGRHTFSPVTVGEPGGGLATGTGVLGAAAAAAGLVAATLALLRRRRPRAALAPTAG